MRAIKTGLLLALAALIILSLTTLPDRLVFEGGDEYVFYCGTSSADCREVFAGENAALTRLTLTNVCGESAVYTEFDLQSYLKQVNGEIVFVEELSDSVNYYCTANLPYSVNLYGREINLHVCVREGGTKVASPIIFGGY